jgi:hypothetical protein
MTNPTNNKSGADNLVAFALAVRTKCQTLLDNQGTLTSLTTEEKSNLVAAINELVTSIANIRTDIQNKTQIDDTKAGLTNVWSASKTSSEIATAASNLKNELLGGAGDAYDTLKELADLIDTNKDAIDALEALAAGHVKFDAAQELTDTQKAQARTNIGAAASTHTHVVSDVTGLQTALDAKANQTAVNTALATKADQSAMETALAAKADKVTTEAALAEKATKAEVGDTSIDLKSIFENGVSEE